MTAITCILTGVLVALGLTATRVLRHYRWHARSQFGDSLGWGVGLTWMAGLAPGIHFKWERYTTRILYRPERWPWWRVSKERETDAWRVFGPRWTLWITWRPGNSWPKGYGKHSEATQ